ncbi:hypothetical protein NB717_003689 [Xanthomonas sacchari]|nr:hypothetical protein [Xanthomonas sacchari]
MAARGIQRFARGLLREILRQQPGDRFVGRRQLEFQPLATAADGRRQARRLRADQPQIAAGLRLFQRLQQGVAGGAVDRVGRVHHHHLGHAVLRGQRQLLRDLAHLLDDDLGAELVAGTVGDERNQLQVRMGASGDQLRAAQGRGGLALTEHVRSQLQRHRPLAQAFRPADQQAVAEAAGVERGHGLVVGALLPGRERHAAHGVGSCCCCTHAASAAATAWATACGGWLASMTRKRCGSCAAR